MIVLRNKTYSWTEGSLETRMYSPGMMGLAKLAGKRAAQQSGAKAQIRRNFRKSEVGQVKEQISRLVPKKSWKSKLRRKDTTKLGTIKEDAKYLRDRALDNYHLTGKGLKNWIRQRNIDVIYDKTGNAIVLGKRNPVTITKKVIHEHIKPKFAKIAKKVAKAGKIVKNSKDPRYRKVVWKGTVHGVNTARLKAGAAISNFQPANAGRSVMNTLTTHPVSSLTDNAVTKTAGKVLATVPTPALTATAAAVAPPLVPFTFMSTPIGLTAATGPIRLVKRGIASLGERLRYSPIPRFQRWGDKIGGFVRAKGDWNAKMAEQWAPNPKSRTVKQMYINTKTGLNNLASRAKGYIPGLSVPESTFELTPSALSRVWA